MPGIVFAECPSVSLRLLSLRLSVLVRHTCIVVLYSSSYITNCTQGTSLQQNGYPLQVDRVYYVTLQVGKEH